MYKTVEMCIRYNIRIEICDCIFVFLYMYMYIDIDIDMVRIYALYREYVYKLVV